MYKVNIKCIVYNKYTQLNTFTIHSIIAVAFVVLEYNNFVLIWIFSPRKRITKTEKCTHTYTYFIYLTHTHTSTHTHTKIPKATWSLQQRLRALMRCFTCSLCFCCCFKRCLGSCTLFYIFVFLWTQLISGICTYIYIFFLLRQHSHISMHLISTI